jgi:uncharacterized integral membrane protein (TIGR00698 family)
MRVKQAAFFLSIIICCFPIVSASTALLIGFLFCQFLKNPFPESSGNWGGYLLKASVIGLGFGIDFHVLLTSAKDNLLITTVFVIAVLLIGVSIGKFLNIEKTTSLLIAVGTAICGGSAIIAIGSILKASNSQLTIATATVFLLNAVALFVFPPLGHLFELSQEQFGVWSAIAIHDTSSVVGAAAKYGDLALSIASVTKMLRIIWIVPVSLIIVFGFKENRESFKVPLFILGFILVSCVHSFFDFYSEYHNLLYKFAKQGLVVSLFIVGSNISIDKLKQIGHKVFMQAVSLWIMVCTAALIFVKYS